MPTEYNPEEHDIIICNLIRKIISQTDASLEQRKTFSKLLHYFDHNIKHPNFPSTHVEHNFKNTTDYHEACHRARCILAGLSINRRGLTRNCRHTNKKKIEEFLARNNINNIDNLEPKLIRKKLVGFYKEILKCRVKDIYREQTSNEEKNKVSIDKSIYNDGHKKTYKDNIVDPNHTITGIDKIIEEEQQNIKQQTSNRIIQYINEDPDRILRNCHPRNRADCNCQVMLRKLLIDNVENITQISRELDIPRATIKDYLENNARMDARCLTLLRENLNLG